MPLSALPAAGPGLSAPKSEDVFQGVADSTSQREGISGSVLGRFAKIGQRQVKVRELRRTCDMTYLLAAGGERFGSGELEIVFELFLFVDESRNGLSVTWTGLRSFGRRTGGTE